MIKKITCSNTYMIKSKHFAITQAFTAIWNIKFELMAVILKFVKRWRKRLKIYVANPFLNLDQYNQLVFHTASKVWRSKQTT